MSMFERPASDAKRLERINDKYRNDKRAVEILVSVAKSFREYEELRHENEKTEKK